jgi:hypothetical protein
MKIRRAVIELLTNLAQLAGSFLDAIYKHLVGKLDSS